MPPELAHESIADIPEGKIVERLLSDTLWRPQMFELYGNPKGVLDRQRVPLPRGFSGDADVLLIAPSRPEQTVALEVKRIKFGVPALRRGGEPNHCASSRKPFNRPIGSIRWDSGRYISM